jgi:hypothetical protein
MKHYLVSITQSQGKSLITISREDKEKNYKIKSEHWFAGLIVSFVKYLFEVKL